MPTQVEIDTLRAVGKAALAYEFSKPRDANGYFSTAPGTLGATAMVQLPSGQSYLVPVIAPLDAFPPGALPDEGSHSGG